MFNNTELSDIVNNAPAKTSIFSSHCLENVAWCIEMLPHSTASYLVYELNKEPAPASEKDLDGPTATGFTTFPEKWVSCHYCLKLYNIVINFNKY